jgi:hypothetical protein
VSAILVIGLVVVTACIAVVLNEAAYCWQDDLEGWQNEPEGSSS